MAVRKKAKAKRKTRWRRLAPFDYIVTVRDGRVVIVGLNDGNIYGDSDQLVTFAAGQGAASFTFDAIEFKKNGSAANPAHKWPFKGRNRFGLRRAFQVS